MVNFLNFNNRIPQQFLTDASKLQAITSKKNVIISDKQTILHLG